MNFRVVSCEKLKVKYRINVLTSEGKGLAGERETQEVDPASNVESVKHGVHFLSHFGERTSSLKVVGIRLVSRSNLDDSIHAA
jgi:hypothetical protein